jgi:hypothetical protein
LNLSDTSILAVNPQMFLPTVRRDIKWRPLPNTGISNRTISRANIEDGSITGQKIATYCRTAGIQQSRRCALERTRQRTLLTQPPARPFTSKDRRPKLVFHLIGDRRPVSDLLLPEQLALGHHGLSFRSSSDRQSGL